MREKIMTILEDLRPDVDFENEVALIDTGILTSMDVVSIVSELADTFDIMISVEHLIPENFNSVTGIANLVESLQSGE